MTQSPVWTLCLLLLSLIAVNTGVHGSLDASLNSPPPSTMKLVKRDPSGVPATISHQNCATRYRRRFKSNPNFEPKCNPGIQVGECFVNARIKNNVFATFEPNDGDMRASREGGAYGECCAYSLMPKEEDLIEVSNANYFCFGWEGPGKDIGEGLPPSGLPGMLAWPFPLICPRTLPNCYSLHYFDQGYAQSESKLVSFAERMPNTTAYWTPPKAANKEHGNSGKRPFLWCNGRGLGCPITTNELFQTANLASMGCDASKCEEYSGDMTIIVGDDRSDQQVARNTAIRTIKSCIPEEDPYCGGPRNSGRVSGGGGGSSGSSGSSISNGNGNQNIPPACDKSRDPDCDQQQQPPTCDPSTDSTCNKKHKTKTTKKCDKSTGENCHSNSGEETQTFHPSKTPECDPATGKYCKKAPFHRRGLLHHSKSDWIV